MAVREYFSGSHFYFTLFFTYVFYLLIKQIFQFGIAAIRLGAFGGRSSFFT